MGIIKNIKNFLKDPSGYIVYLNQHDNYKNASRIPDWIYVKAWYKKRTGKTLHLFHPKELNEKMQWLKIHDRNPEFSGMADKANAKKYLEKVIGSQYIIPTLGVWNSFDDIDFAKLPNEFVLKCTHDSGSIVICRDKSSFDVKAAKEKLNDRLSRNYFWSKREWPYKDVKPRIIGEPLLKNADGSPLVDYKFYCYGGKPRYFMYSLGEAEHNVRNHKFDMELNSIDYKFKEKAALPVSEIHLPDNIGEMISLVEKLCSGIQHIRVDLYNIDGKIYAGELTFFSGAGILNICSKEYSDELASYISLKKSKVGTS